MAVQHYFSRPYRGTNYRLYYLGAFADQSAFFTVNACQLSRPDGIEIEEPARLKWAAPAPNTQSSIRRGMRFNDGLIDPIKSALGRERQEAARYRLAKAGAA